MIQPTELKSELPIEIANGTISTTTKVWAILKASYDCDLRKVKELVDESLDLIYAQYNYAPPIHFAVREGHTELVEFLLDNGAHDPGYRFYPFQESLQTVANDRGFSEIENLLDNYDGNPAKHRYNGDNGRIIYNRTLLQDEFEQAVDKNEIQKVKQLLHSHPEFALDETYFWSEGILLFAAKENNREMTDLLMSYGAKVPSILKWTQFYYFETYAGASYMMEKGMNPDTMSWQHVTILHDMAQKGSIDKAELLLKWGADINPIDEAYLSTPLGLAARWGNTEMVKFLLGKGADPVKSGAEWSSPLAWARSKGHTGIETILKKAGAK